MLKYTESILSIQVHDLINYHCYRKVHSPSLYATNDSNFSVNIVNVYDIS